MIAGVLVVAGSETSATTIAAALYLLLTNSDAYQKLLTEVWGAFKSEAEITIPTVNKLEYMLACLNETMRMLPAVAGGLPRVMPSGGRVLNGKPVPQDVSASLWRMISSDGELCCRPSYTNGIGLSTTMTHSSGTLPDSAPNDFSVLRSLLPMCGSFCSLSMLGGERASDDRNQPSSSLNTINCQ
jgi:hypothetical protein